MVDSDGYRCVCFSCDEQREVEEYDRAQQFFDDHAERGHEVEIERLDRRDGDES